MKGVLYIHNDSLGTVDFKVTDEGMGGIGGELTPTDAYKKYKKQIQKLFDEKGIANIEDFDFKIVLLDGTTLAPEGGVGVTDSSEFDEIYVESAGLDYKIIELVRSGE